jgi:hypothetical protein
MGIILHGIVAAIRKLCDLFHKDRNEDQRERGWTQDEVDAALADEVARRPGQGLDDWRESIVDLLKLLGRDDGMPARRALAREIGFDGPVDGSAASNKALHAAVMKELRENNFALPGAD